MASSNKMGSVDSETAQDLSVERMAEVNITASGVKTGLALQVTEK